MSVGVGRLAAAWLIEEPQFGGAGRRRENEMTEPGSRGGHSPSYGGDTSREWGAGARRSAPRGASDMQRVRSDGPGWGGAWHFVVVWMLDSVKISLLASILVLVLAFL